MRDRKQFYTYIVTDSNRKFLRPEIGHHLHSYTRSNHIGSLTVSDVLSQGNRIVFLERHTSQEEAENRFIELSGMTRLVRERLIRRTNPNWLSIASLRPNLPKTKKTVVFA